TWVVGLGVLIIVGIMWLSVSHMGAILALAPRMPINAPVRYDKAIKALDACTDELIRYYALGDAAMWSVDVGKLDDAERYAKELLALNEKMGRDWNNGNAIHKGHSALGRIAIKRGDVAEGERQLALAATSKGSPQMDTFGPNMSLPRDLLATGKPSAKAVVLAYFDHLPTFWTMDGGAISVWRNDVEHDREPNFGSHLLF
ncbi:MAG: hypothetical protein ABIZ64_06640, partial [Casimicrobium sp.]